MPLTSDPRRDEELLAPAHVLEAIGKLDAGPAQQEFYRTLAGDSQADARREAAIHLEPAAANNAAVLRSLSTDGDPEVTVSALVTRLIGGDESAQAGLLAALAQPAQQAVALQELSRVPGTASLAFASASLESIAGNRALSDSLREMARQLQSRK